MKKIIMFIVVVMILITGCSNGSTENNQQDNAGGQKDYGEALIDEDIYEETKKLKRQVYEQKLNKNLAPLTGLPVAEENVNRVPIAVMYDNYFRARPQASIAKADIVYEILAEGRITRYLAIFQSNYPEIIGSIRSARPYFIKRALEYDPLYVHVGGSNQAFADIKRFNVKDIDALSSGGNTFWRKGHKPIPNNMYSNAEVIIKEAMRKNYDTDVAINYDLISTDAIALKEGTSGENISIEYKEASSSDPSGYYSQFRYDENKKQYVRYINDKLYLDENGDRKIYAKNIIVQFAHTKVIDDVGRREIQMIDSNKGYYLTHGKKIDISWEKDGLRELTRYYDENGEEIKLNKGNTWILVVPMTIAIEIE